MPAFRFDHDRVQLVFAEPHIRFRIVDLALLVRFENAVAIRVQRTRPAITRQPAAQRLQ